MKDLDKLWVGLVEDNRDPKKLGRVKVRVQGLFGDVPVEDIPWSYPIKSLSSRSFEIPAVGKIVSVIFPNDMIYESYYMFADHYNVNLKKKLDDLSEDEYVNFVAVIFDHRTKVYSDDTSLTMDYKYNKITIDNNNINLELKDNSQKLNLGTKNSTEQAVLGNHWFDWMDKFVNALLKPTSLIGNSGAAILKPDIDRLLVEYESLRETFVSRNVYIVDNKKVDKLEMKYNSPIMDDGLQLNNSSVVKDGVMGEDLKDKIIEQKTKELEKVKESMPSYASEEIKFVDVPETGNSEEHGEISQYKEISNGKETEITKDRYEAIKNKEMYDTNINAYDIVDEQSDADDIAFAAETFFIEENIDSSSDPDEIAYDYDPNRKIIYVANDNTKYIDKNVTVSQQGGEKGLKKYGGTGLNLPCGINTSNFSKTLDIGSKYYKLGDVAITYSRIKDQNVDGTFFSKYQIACNLKFLTINCLDKIKERYPDMELTSTIRNGTNRSEHNTGQAADMVFKKHKKKEYYDIILWIYSNVPYSQLFLEYRPKENPKGGWIHISYSQKNGNVLPDVANVHSTLVNDSSSPPGLAGGFKNVLADINST